MRLLQRDRSGARLTAEGERFQPYALAVLAALESVENVLGLANTQTMELLHIGALPSVAPDLLPLALTDFRVAHPAARVLIQTAANAPLLHALKTSEVDVVLGRMADPQMMLGLSFELLYVEPLVLAVRKGHPLAGRTSISLHEVDAYPFVVSPKGTIPRHSTESFFQSRGMTMPSNVTETLSVSVARQITRQSDAIWFSPAGAVRADLADQVLRRLAISTAGSEEPVGLLLRSEGPLSAPGRAFVAILREAASKRRGDLR
jgi:DNA-binding transcriptional LysR family regulator